jgi:predicted RNase H-like nuclease
LRIAVVVNLPSQDKAVSALVTRGQHHDITFIGFDSAWTDNQKAPGAICSLKIGGGGAAEFHPPRLVSFDQALTFIREVRSASVFTLIALDQPTIVPNLSGKRPVERAVSSLIGWLGGGVQPSHRGRVGMFCDASPIWRFLAALAATEDPECARTATEGLHLIEVFPALALPSIHPEFFGRLRAPKYNPGRRTFRLEDWRAVAGRVALAFQELGQDEAARWCLEAALIEKPRKSDQDRLDAMVCVLIAMRWRLGPRPASMTIGCAEHGYMVLPASPEVRARLEADALRLLVPIDRVVPAVVSA